MIYALFPVLFGLYFAFSIPMFAIIWKWKGQKSAVHIGSFLIAFNALMVLPIFSQSYSNFVAKTALKLNAPLLCTALHFTESIPSFYIGSDMRTSCLLAIITSYNNPTACMIFPGRKDKCFADIAFRTNNGSFCSGLRAGYDDSCQNELLSMITNSPDNWNAPIPECNPRTDRCYYLLGILKQDERYCKDIHDYITLLDCYAKVENSQISLQSAQKHCEQIGDPFIAGHCWHVFAVNIPDASLCDKLSAPYIKTEECKQEANGQETPWRF
jgi:hypothetical protein